MIQAKYSRETRVLLSSVGCAILWLFNGAALAAEKPVVDFRFSPPEWQTAICLPDDAQKTLVDRSGELLYSYGQGGREFATRVGVQVSADAVWRKQELLSPRVPIVRTYRSVEGLDVVEEAFAVTGLPKAQNAVPTLQRTDGGGDVLDWAKTPVGTESSLKNIAVHFGGSIHYEVAVPAGATRRVALALCEGWWKEPGKRVQILRVEGADPKVVDPVGDFGANVLGTFWFDAKDVNGDGKIEITVEASPLSGDKNTFLNGFWVFPADTAQDDKALVSGQLNALALTRMSEAKPGGPPRNDMILVHVSNTGKETRQWKPRLVIDTTLPFQFQTSNTTRVYQNNNLTFETNRPTVVIDGHDVVVSSLKMTGVVREEKSRREIELESISVRAGESTEFFVMHCTGSPLILVPSSLRVSLSPRQNAESYWEKAPLPHGRIQVPDPGIQALVDSSIRNIWQAREIKNGLPVFQVGPTCYRGLWIVDGAFLLESAAMVGAGKEARSGITYTLGQQKPTGAFEVLSPSYFKENGIVLWTCVRHAMLTQDKAWLESVWPKLEKACNYIVELRRRSLEDNTSLDDGINPPGNIDGGLWGEVKGVKSPEFSNVHWNLTGMRAFIQAAHWLGKEESAVRWQKEYDDFYATFRKASERDTVKDSQGNSYVPIMMGNAGNELPQRAQWTFCHAVYPGQIYGENDPLAASTMAMLEATEREGMVYGTGWDATGIWNYFASFYGHAWLWQGHGQKAAQVLYAYANHASPTCVWREEQSLKGEPFKKVGDMPHNWASAEFIRLTVHLLALDRGDELHLLEGFPKEWAGPGMVTRLDGVATPFGPLYMTAAADADGKSVTLEFKALAANCKAVVVHLPDGTTRRMEAQKAGSLVFKAP